MCRVGVPAFVVSFYFFLRRFNKKTTSCDCKDTSAKPFVSIIFCVQADPPLQLYTGATRVPLARYKALDLHCPLFSPKFSPPVPSSKEKKGSCLFSFVSARLIFCCILLNDKNRNFRRPSCACLPKACNASTPCPPPLTVLGR